MGKELGPKVPQQLLYCKVSLWNTLAYALNEAARGKEPHAQLRIALSYVESIKSTLTIEEYEKYPEFMETEAAVLYTISSLTTSGRAFKNWLKRDKLQEALALCRKCREVAKTRQEEDAAYMRFVDETEGKIAAALNKLR